MAKPFAVSDRSLVAFQSLIFGSMQESELEFKYITEKSIKLK